MSCYSQLSEMSLFGYRHLIFGALRNVFSRACQGDNETQNDHFKSSILATITMNL